MTESVWRRAAVGVLALVPYGCASGSVPEGPRPTSATTGSVPRAERPTYALGDRWIRNDGIWEVIRVEPDRYVFSSATGEELHLTKDLVLALYRLHDRALVRFTPEPHLDWPLTVGRRDTLTGTFQALYGAPYDATLHWAVEAYEDVTVPAGTFKAFRISYSVTPRTTTEFGPQWARGVVPSTWNYRLWYAPEVRQIVKSDRDQWHQWKIRFEVVAIDPGEAEPLRVDVRGPKDQAQLGPESTPTLVGTVASGKGVASVSVTVNGAIVGRDDSQAEPKRTIVLDVLLPLRDGKNVVLVTAKDTSGTTSQEARTVFYTAPLAVRLPLQGQTLRVPSEHISLAFPVPVAVADEIVYVVLNGIIVDYFRADPARTPVYDVKMKLREGENDLSIRYRFLPYEDRKIVFDRSASVAALPPADDVSAADARRQAEEERKQQQERQERTEAELRRLEEERKAAAERQRRESEERRAEEQRLAEQRRLAEEQRRTQEAVRLGEEQRRLAEERRVAEERRAAEAQRQEAEAQRLAEEKRRGEEQQRLAEERRRQEEQRRLASLPPLRVTLSSPSDQARVEHESIALAGLVTAGRG
jgi:hypothetical protein